MSYYDRKASQICKVQTFDEREKDRELCGIKGKLVCARTINRYHVILFTLYLPVGVEVPLFFLQSSRALFVVSSNLCTLKRCPLTKMKRARVYRSAESLAGHVVFFYFPLVGDESAFVTFVYHRLCIY